MRNWTTQRRGSVYLLVLGLSMLVTVIGLGSVAVSRLTARTVSEGKDFTDARMLAFSAAEHAFTRINADTNWRTTFNGQTIQMSLGRGTFSWHITDESDGNLTDDPTEAFTIWTTGTVGRASYSMKVHMVPGSSSTSRFTAGVCSLGSVSLAGSAVIDSYDSTLGAYGGSNVGSAAVVRTNSTGANTVSLGGGTKIKGSVQVGPGADPSTVISNTSLVTGTKTAMSQQITLPTLTAPTNLGASTGDMSYTSTQVGTLSGNYHVNNLTVGNSGRMKISGAVTMLVDGNINLSGSGVVEILSGGSLTIYVKGSTSIGNGASMSIDGQNLSSIKLLNLGTNTVNISGSAAVVQGVIVSPNGAVTIGNSGQVFGAIQTKQLSLSGSGFFHEDRRITTSVDKVVLPGDTTTTPRADSISRVVQ